MMLAFDSQVSLAARLSQVLLYTCWSYMTPSTTCDICTHQQQYEDTEMPQSHVHTCYHRFLFSIDSKPCLVNIWANTDSHLAVTCVLIQPFNRSLWSSAYPPIKLTAQAIKLAFLLVSRFLLPRPYDKSLMHWAVKIYFMQDQSTACTYPLLNTVVDQTCQGKISAKTIPLDWGNSSAVDTQEG